MNIDYDSIGARIKSLRVRRGFSQEELADRADISRVYVSCIERGERIPSLESLINIANALSVSADSLLADNIYVAQETFPVDSVADCSFEEQSILYDNMSALKSILKGYKITRR